MLVTLPLRLARFSITLPSCSSGTSTQTCSKGSQRVPSISLYRTVGRETRSSKPSRRIVSTSTAICMAPRALTRKRVPSSVSSMLMEMLDCVSRMRRSRIWREVTFLPSLPPSGPLLTENSICTVAGSISTKGRASASFEAARVSPMSTSSKPARPTMSPATALVTSSVSPAPEKLFILVTLTRSILPLLRCVKIVCPTFTSPERTRPIAIRPT